MADVDEVFNYVMGTPDNTNPAILREMLNKIASGHNNSGVFIINGIYEIKEDQSNPGKYYRDYISIDKSFEEAKQAYINGKIQVFISRECYPSDGEDSGILSDEAEIYQLYSCSLDDEYGGFNYILTENFVEKYLSFYPGYVEDDEIVPDIVEWSSQPVKYAPGMSRIKHCGISDDGSFENNAEIDLYDDNGNIITDISEKQDFVNVCYDQSMVVILNLLWNDTDGYQSVQFFREKKYKGSQNSYGVYFSRIAFNSNTNKIEHQRITLYRNNAVNPSEVTATLSITELNN